MSDPRGFAFPFRIDPASGAIASAAGSEKLRQNLLFLLQVDIGERVLRRDYGAGLRSLLHEPVNSAFAGLIKGQIIKAIAQHEPRVELLDLTVQSASAPGRIDVQLVYAERATQRVDELSVALAPPGETAPAAGGAA